MISRLVHLVVLVAVAALLALFLRWVMDETGVVGMVRTAVWIGFGLIVILAILGLFGYGRDLWKSSD